MPSPRAGRAATQSTARRCTSTCSTPRRTTRSRTVRSTTPIRPSSRSATSRAWDGLQHGHLHCVGTDEVCCNLSVKVRGNRIDDTTGGNSGVEPRVPVIYTETVEKRGYSLEKFVDVVSSNAARILGLYPRKGAIAVGSDADIVVLDTSKRRTVRAQDLHETDYTPWEGKEVAAWPSATVLRGKVMVADGKFYGDLKDGQYLKRKIPDAIRARHPKESR